IEEVADELPGPVAGVPEELRAANLDARFQGVEIAASALPLRWLTLEGNYTYLNIGEETGALLNRPRHRGSFTATAARDHVFEHADRASAAIQVFAIGNRASADPFAEPIAFTPGRIGGYARVDLALSYMFGGWLSPLTVTATVRNLLNHQYEESIGFPAPPAWFLVGLRYSLEPRCVNVL